MHKYCQIIKDIYIPIFISLMIFILVISINSYSSHSGLFTEFDIKVIGNKYIDTIMIENEIYPNLKSSLLSLNLSEIQAKLEKIQYIEVVQISQILPKTLLIHIIERSPILMINKEEEKKFMDLKGFLLPVNEKSIITFPVPVISILDENIFIEDYSDNISRIFQFLINQYPNFYNNLNEITITSECWELHHEYNTKIYIDGSYVKNQLIILKEFEKTIFPEFKLSDYRYIDLRINNQIVVKEKYHKG